MPFWHSLGLKEAYFAVMNMWDSDYEILEPI